MPHIASSTGFDYLHVPIAFENLNLLCQHDVAMAIDVFQINSDSICNSLKMNLTEPLPEVCLFACLLPQAFNRQAANQTLNNVVSRNVIE